MKISFFLFVQKCLPGLRRNFLWYLLQPVYFFHNYWMGFFLGVFNRNDLNEIDDRTYRKRNKYLSNNYNKIIHKWEEDAIHRFFPKPGLVLVTAVGAGREAYSLNKFGYEVHAYESNEKLRAFGNEFFKSEGLPIVIQPINRNSFPQNGQNYDAIIFGWGGYTHVKGSHVRIELLKDAWNLLKPDGVILISFWSWKFYIERFKQLNLSRIHKVGNWTAKLFVNEKVEFGDVLTPEYTRFFKDDEIEAELNAAGFELLLFDDSQYGNAVARKIS